MIPQVVFFDLDNTLTESKHPLSPSMVKIVTALLTRTKVAVTSGAKISLIKEQVPDTLPEEVKSNLYLLPTSGSELYEYADGEWKNIYKNTLTPEEVEEITVALTKAGTETGLVDFSTPSFGLRIENRGSQMALTPPGQDAPIEIKAAWDPERIKRPILREAVAKLLPQYEVKAAGRTTIDVTKHGIDKAYGVRELSKRLNIPIEQMVYIGDALFPGGNDEVVKKTGIKTVQTEGPEHTEKLIEELLAQVY